MSNKVLADVPIADAIPRQFIQRALPDVMADLEVGHQEETGEVAYGIPAGTLPLDLLADWSPIWHKNTGRMPGEFQKHFLLNARSAKSMFDKILSPEFRSTRLPIISIALFGDSHNLTSPHALGIGFSDGSCSYIPMGIFQQDSDFSLRFAITSIVNASHIIKVVYGFAAFLEIVKVWFADMNMVWTGARSIVDILEFYGEDLKTVWSDTKEPLIEHCSGGFRQYTGLPFCAKLSEIFSVLFRVSEVSDITAFHPSFWNSLADRDNLKRRHLVMVSRILMHQMYVFLFFILASSHCVWKSRFQTGMKLLMSFIETHWVFPRNIKRSSFFNHTVEEARKEVEVDLPSMSDQMEVDKEMKDTMQIKEEPTEEKMEVLVVVENSPASSPPIAGPVNRTRYVHRRVVNLVSLFGGETRLFTRKLPRCLYFRYNYLYAKYRFTAAKLACLLSKAQLKTNAWYIRKFLFRYTMGKAIDSFYRERRKSVCTEHLSVNTPSNFNTLSGLRIAHPIIRARLNANRPTKGISSKTVRPPRFYKFIGRQKHFSSAYWLRRLQSQRRTFASLQPQQLGWKHKYIHCRQQWIATSRRYTQKAMPTATISGAAPTATPIQSQRSDDAPPQHSVPCSHPTVRADWNTHVEQLMRGRDSAYDRWLGATGNNAVPDSPANGDWGTLADVWIDAQTRYDAWRRCSAVWARQQTAPTPAHTLSFTTTDRTANWVEQQQAQQIEQLARRLVTQLHIGTKSALAIAAEFFETGKSGFEDQIANLKP
jgi:hypothetical protein